MSYEQAVADGKGLDGSSEFNNFPTSYQPQPSWQESSLLMKQSEAKSDDVSNTLSVEELQQILAASQRVGQATSLERMLRQTVDEVLRLVPGHAAAIGLLDLGRSWVRLVAGGEAGQPLEGQRLRPSEIKGLLEVALHDEALVTENDCMADEYAEVYRIARLGRGVAMPLRRQGQVIGVLGVFRQVPQGAGFKGSECELLEMFASQIGPLLGAQQKITEAETALKSRDEFLSIASHDLRNPLTALRGFSQLTIRAINKVPDEQPVPRQPLSTNLQRIIKQTDSLDKLIGKLLDVSRINTGRLEVRPELLDLSELVREVSERCIIAIVTSETENGIEPEHRHKLQKVIPAQPLWGQFDRERMAQVVTNLLDNAVKYSPEGGTVKLELHRLNETTAELRVSDQGVGIPEEKQDIIFHRWSRVHSSREDEVGGVNGLGLGLFICREIVRKHGGQIVLESAPGQGSTFIVTVPLSGEEKKLTG